MSAYRELTNELACFEGMVWVGREEGACLIVSLEETEEEEGEEWLSVGEGVVEHSWVMVCDVKPINPGSLREERGISGLL